jgi:hypothetical protein
VSGQTVTQGIVSATGRSRLGINTYEDFIQTDAAINPGNSGGALINAHGELVGINTAIFTRSGGSHGIGFAIPVDLARDVMTQIMEQGQVVRGWLGIEVQEITPQLAESFGLSDRRGVLIAGVLRDSPAGRAGMQPGDIITHIGGDRVNECPGRAQFHRPRPPRDTLHMQGIRDGRRSRSAARWAGARRGVSGAAMNWQEPSNAKAHASLRDVKGRSEIPDQKGPDRASANRAFSVTTDCRRKGRHRRAPANAAPCSYSNLCSYSSD